MKATKESSKFKQLYSGDLIQLNARGDIMYLGCCDCGLVHDVGVGIERNGNIGIMFERNNELTRERRKQKKFKCIPRKS